MMIGFGGSGLLVLGLVGLRRREQLIMAVVVMVVLSLSGCGGGSSGKGGTGLEPDPEAGPNYTVTNLAAGTQYFWKIRATDSKGAFAESEVWQFTTQ